MRDELVWIWKKAVMLSLIQRLFKETEQNYGNVRRGGHHGKNQIRNLPNIKRKF